MPIVTLIHSYHNKQVTFSSSNAARIHTRILRNLTRASHSRTYVGTCPLPTLFNYQGEDVSDVDESPLKKSIVWKTTHTSKIMENVLQRMSTVGHNINDEKKKLLQK